MYLISLILSFLSPVSIGHSQSISTPWTKSKVIPVAAFLHLDDLVLVQTVQGGGEVG